jgi:hypothetical protein
LLNALISIEEYWNGSQNERAMSDALAYITATAAEAIAKAQEPPDDEWKSQPS